MLSTTTTEMIAGLKSGKILLHPLLKLKIVFIAWERREWQVNHCRNIWNILLKLQFLFKVWKNATSNLV